MCWFLGYEKRRKLPLGNLRLRFAPERFHTPAAFSGGLRRLHLRRMARKASCRTFRSVVLARSFCLRVSACPFGAGFPVSPEPIIRLYVLLTQGYHETLGLSTSFPMVFYRSISISNALAKSLPIGSHQSQAQAGAQAQHFIYSGGGTVCG